MTTTATAIDTHHDGHHGADEGTRPKRFVRFARHYLLMIVAMYAGMLILDPLYDAVATHAGYADPWAELPVLSAWVMAGNMTAPMVLLICCAIAAASAQSATWSSPCSRRPWPPQRYTCWMLYPQTRS